MADIIVPADHFPDPYDTPLNDPGLRAEPERYNPPPRESLPPTERRGSAPKAPVKPPLNYTPMTPNELTDRLTVSIQAHHEQWMDETNSFTCQFQALTEVSDQSLKRKIVVQPGKKTLLTWSEYPVAAGYIGIKNQAGVKQMVRRSVEQEEALKHQILLVSLCKDCPDQNALIVRPGRCFFAEMQDDTEIWFKSASGVIEILVFLFPR